MKNLKEYDVVSPETFEQYLSKVSMDYITTRRSYENKTCYLAKNKQSGFALSYGGIINHVFSTKKGEGKKAITKAVEYGGDRLNLFTKSNLETYYKQLGFKVFYKDKEKTFMGLPQKPKCAYMI